MSPAENIAPSDFFTAGIALPEGVFVSINAPSLDTLAGVLARLRPVAAATRRSAAPGKPAAGAATDPVGSPASSTTGPSAQAAAGVAAGDAGNGQGAATAGAAAGTSAQVPGAAASATPAASGDAGNASASTGTQASAQPAASGSAASGGDELPGKTPEELLKAVGERVATLAKKGREFVKGELKKFNVERGGELTDAQKVLFLRHTESLVA